MLRRKAGDLWHLKHTKGEAMHQWLDRGSSSSPPRVLCEQTQRVQGTETRPRAGQIDPSRAELLRVLPIRALKNMGRIKRLENPSAPGRDGWGKAGKILPWTELCLNSWIMNFFGVFFYTWVISMLGKKKKKMNLWFLVVCSTAQNNLYLFFLLLSANRDGKFEAAQWK